MFSLLECHVGASCCRRISQDLSVPPRRTHVSQPIAIFFFFRLRFSRRLLTRALHHGFLVSLLLFLVLFFFFFLSTPASCCPPAPGLIRTIASLFSIVGSRFFFLFFWAPLTLLRSHARTGSYNMHDMGILSPYPSCGFRSCVFVFVSF